MTLFAESKGVRGSGNIGPLHGLPLGCGQSSLAFLSICSSYILLYLSLTKVLSQASLPPLSLHLPSSSLLALQVKARSLPLHLCLVYVTSCPCHCVSSFCHCSSLYPLRAAPSPLQPSLVNKITAPLQVLLPSNLVTLWPSLMNKLPAPMSENQAKF